MRIIRATVVSSRSRSWTPIVLWWLCWAACNAFVLLPGPVRSPFSGLPLSAKASLLFALLVVVAAGTLLFRPPRRIHPAVPAALIAAVALKLALATMLVPGGWRGEYHHAMRKMDKTYTPMTRAWFQNGFVARQYRVDRAVQFDGVNFGLMFINDRPPDPPDYSGYKRDIGHPLIVRWTGHVAAERTEQVSTKVSANGAVAIRVDRREVFRANNPRRRPVTWTLTAGAHEIEIIYNKPPNVKPAIDVAPFGAVNAVPASATDVRRSRLATHGIDLLGLLSLALLALAFVQAYKRVTRFILEDIWLEPDKVVVLALFAIFFAGGVWRAVPVRHATMQLGIGDDPIAYEASSRMVLRNGLLMLTDAGDAQPYYFYPFYPYALAASHVLWGDDFSSILILNYFCAASVIVLVWLILRRRLARGSVILVLLLFAIFARSHVLRWAQQSYTDNLFVPAAITTVLVTIIAFETKKKKWLFLAGILTALAAATRPSMLLHLPVMALAVLLYRDFGPLLKRLGSSMTFVLGFVAGVAPFTIRNWIVSKRFVLLVASFIMLPYFMYPPGQRPPSFLVQGHIPTGMQAIGQAWDTFAERPLQVTWLEIRKVLFTFGITAVGPPVDGLPWHLPIFPILFGLSLWTRRIPRPVAAALLTFAASHLLAMVVAAPWTYGYKTILPFHITMILGAAFLLPRRDEWYSIVAPREQREAAPMPDRFVSVVLPTYNEKDSIRACIQDFFATGVVGEVLVINNNAAPGTSEEVAGTGAIEIFEPRQGYGSAIKRGLREAKGDYIVICEPDGTFVAGDIHKLLAYAEDFDVVYGSRTSQQMVWKGANMGMFLRWGNWVVAKYLEFLYNATSLTDVGCTMRLIRKDVAQALLPQFRIDGSQFGPEMMIMSLKAGFYVIQIPVNYLPRVGVSAVTGDPAKALMLGLQMIWLITSRRFEQLVKPPHEAPIVSRKTADSQL